MGQLTVICLNIFIGLLTILTILLLDPMWYIDVSVHKSTSQIKNDAAASLTLHFPFLLCHESISIT